MSESKDLFTFYQNISLNRSNLINCKHDAFAGKETHRYPTGFIYRSTKVKSRAILTSMKPNWLFYSFIKFRKNWQFLTKKWL